PARKRGGRGEKVMYQNRVSIIGFVGNDAQLKSTKNGAPVAVFSVATPSSWKSAKGSYESPTHLHRCGGWGALSPVAAQTGKRASRPSRGAAALPRIRETVRHERSARAHQASGCRDPRQPHPQTRPRGEAGRACSPGRSLRTSCRRAHLLGPPTQPQPFGA